MAVIIERGLELPLANEWTFSSQNKALCSPAHKEEAADLTQTTPAITRLIDTLQRNYVQPDWRLAAVLSSDMGSLLGVTVVFTRFGMHAPLIPTQDYKHFSNPEGFLKPDVVKKGADGEPEVKPVDFSCSAGWEVDKEPIRRSIKGTNLYTIQAVAGYNPILVTGRRGLIRKKEVTETYYQTGVGFVDTWLALVIHNLTLARQELYLLNKDLTQQITKGPIVDRVAFLESLYTDEPEPLFRPQKS